MQVFLEEGNTEYLISHSHLSINKHLAFPKSKFERKGKEQERSAFLRRGVSEGRSKGIQGMGWGLRLTARSSRVTKPLSLAPQSWKKRCSSSADWEDQDSGSGATGASWPSAGSRICRRRLEPSFRPFWVTLSPLSMALWPWGQSGEGVLGC